MNQNPLQIPSNPNQMKWYKADIESKFGLRGGRFTSVNHLFTMFIGLLCTLLFYVSLLPFEGSDFADMFTKRGPTQHATMFLTFWSLAILFIKWLKVRMQHRLLQYDFIPLRPDFVLGTSTVDFVLHGIYASIDDPSRFTLSNRIVIALSNLKNLGRISDVDEIFRSQGDMDESQMESSYTVLNGFIWAIPVLGFIGTVLGLSDAIASFGTVLQGEGGINEIKSSLRMVTGGLSTAFETTLVALVASMILQLLMTFLKKREQDFLDDCSSYCLRKVVNRIRIKTNGTIDDPHDNSQEEEELVEVNEYEA